MPLGVKTPFGSSSKMEKTKYMELVKKLNRLLHEDETIPFTLSPDTDFESMTKNELLLAHVLLHKFYATGNKTLSKEEIKILHDEVKKHIKHTRFDDLDY